MKVLVAHAPHEMSFEDRPIPEPEAGEVLVKTRSVALCGSDIHLYAGTHPYRTYPMVFGHEASGWVSKVGKGVDKLSKGDHVVLEPCIWCGECYPCSIGRYNCCSNMRTTGVTVPGALAEYYTVPARALHKVPQDLAPQIAALCEPHSVGFHASARGNIGANDQVVVIGAGPIGLAILSGAKQRGAQVAVADLIDMRLDIARKMGADLTINSQQNDPIEMVRDWTGGNMASVVVEAVGIPVTIESTVGLVADGGRIVIAGVTEQFAKFRGVDITKKELTIYGSRNNLLVFKDAVDYVVNNPEVAGQMITREYPFAEAIEAFETTETHPEQVCKVIINVEN